MPLRLTPMAFFEPRGNFTGTVTVVHFNDVHGSLTETSTSIGYPKIATFIDAQRAVNPNTLVLDAGDVIAGNPSAALGKGVSFATILNIDCHTHTVYPAGTERNGVLIVQTGAYGENIGTVNLEFAEGQLIGKNAQLHPRDEFENIPEKGSTRVALDNFEVRLGHFFDSNVGATSVVLEGSRNILRTQETNLGNLFTDAIRQNSGADLALYPAGNISGPIGPGPIVRRDVYTFDYKNEKYNYKNENYICTTKYNC